MVVGREVLWCPESGRGGSRVVMVVVGGDDLPLYKLPCEAVWYPIEMKVSFVTR